MTFHHLFMLTWYSLYSNTLTKIATAKTNYFELFWTIFVEEGDRNTHYTFIIIGNCISIGNI